MKPEQDLRKRCIRCEDPLNHDDRFIVDKKSGVTYCIPCIKAIFREAKEKIKEQDEEQK